MPEKKIGSTYKDLQERDLYILTEFFKLLGNPTRIHILFLLMEQDACVSDLAEQKKTKIAAISTPKPGKKLKGTER